MALIRSSRVRDERFRDLGMESPSKTTDSLRGDKGSSDGTGRSGEMGVLGILYVCGLRQTSRVGLKGSSSGDVIDDEGEGVVLVKRRSASVGVPLRSLSI